MIFGKGTDDKDHVGRNTWNKRNSLVLPHGGNVLVEKFGPLSIRRCQAISMA
ncbi:MAG: hypothetical protein ABI691_03505 [Ginsengibacter sp.]